MQKLYVYMNGVEVGALEKKTSELSFYYTTTWLSHSSGRALSLSMPLTSVPYKGNVVYYFFDNLLPDHPVVRARLQAFFHSQSDSAFDLLCHIGRDCIGAIQLIAKKNPIFSQLKYDSMTDEELSISLKNYRSAPLGMIDPEQEFRISIAGVQEKSAFLFINNKWVRPLGSTPTSHIFKLPMQELPQSNIHLENSCENEWLCLKIVEAFGLPVAKSDVNIFADCKVLVVERFDRKWSEDNKTLLRLPQEDFCQSMGISSNLKYQADGGPGIKDIMNILLASQTSLQDRDLFFKTQIIFSLLAAIDGHAKNFSIFLKANGVFQLTPIYDVLSVHPLIKTKKLHPKKIKMAMCLYGKNKHYLWDTIQYRHFLSTAKQAKYSLTRAQLCLDEIFDKVESVIDEVSKILPKNFPENVSQPIFDGMLKFKKRILL